MAFISRTIALSLAISLAVGCATDDTPNPRDNTTNGMDAGQDTEVDTNDTVLELRGISPDQGSVAGGTTLTLSGRGFQTGMSVKFGDADGLSVVVLTTRQATVVAPAASMPGPVDIIVTNPDSATDMLPGAYTYVEAPDPQVGFCRLAAQSPVTAILGQDLPSLYAEVFMEGVTQGAGQGPGIEGELGWGTGDPAQFTFIGMSYNVDKDGLNPGDLSNDEYGAVPQIPSTGTLSYVARFRAHGRTDWVYCDLDGSDNGADQLGSITIQEAQQPTITYCQVQNISPVNATTGIETERLYAFVYADGITPGAGQGSGIQGELGYGPTGGDLSTFTYTNMVYNTDLDGTTPGDLANDEYSGRLKVSTAGTYDYAARFKTTTGDWMYCDLEGRQGEGARPSLIVTDPVAPTVGFCNTQPATRSALSNTDIADLTALLFVAGSTNAAGKGAGVVAELRYGPKNAAPATWTHVVTPTYLRDEDGLTPGDMANDVYTATIPGQAAGDYGYAYRFSTDGGTNWTWCDTTGTPPFEATEVGSLEVRDAFVNLPDSCNTQYPAIQPNVVVGQSIVVFGRVTEANVTGLGSPNADLKAELLVGPATANPATDLAQFVKIPATLRTMGVIDPAPGEDEYEATYAVPAAGAYAVAYRFSADGGQNWSVCDFDGTTTPSEFDVKRIGQVSVFEASQVPNLIDYCNIWQSNLAVNQADPAPSVTIETFEAGLTDSGAFMASSIEAQVGVGPFFANPALPGVFTWSAAMPYKGPRPGAPNNQEYEADAYTTAPQPGSYSIAVRVRRAGTTAWAYCDTNNSTMDYFLNQSAQLFVSP